MSSNSGPISLRTCRLAPWAIRRSSRTSRASCWAYSGSRSGPRTTAATTTRTMNSLGLIPNTSQTLIARGAEFHPDLSGGGTARPHRQRHRVTGPLGADRHDQFVGLGDRLGADLRDHVAGLDSRLGRGPAGGDRSDSGGAGLRADLHPLALVLAVQRDADDRVLRLAGADQFLRRPASLVARDREAEADAPRRGAGA